MYRSAAVRRTRPATRYAAVAVALAFTLIGAACSSDEDGEGGDAAGASQDSTTTTAPDPVESLPAPDEPGPYGVGRTTLQLDDTSRQRPLVADVWYPTEPDATGEPSVYQFIPGIEFSSDTALAEVPVSTEGPFPLVIYSHGSGGLRYIATFFTELLASHGFVVAAVDHVGNTAVELITGGEADRDQVAVDRVLDVQFLIDEMLAASEAADGEFAGAVDAERIGVTGHSFGGFTAFASVAGHTNPAGTAPGDDRVDALVAMAPASGLNSTEELGAVDVPTLLVSGTKDVTTPIDPDTEKAWDNISGRPLWRVDITDGGHQSFTDVCDYQVLLPTLNAPQLLIDTVDDYAEEGCVGDLAPIEQAHQLTNRNSVAFLLAFVAGESDYEAFLADEIPGEVVQVKE
jgi:predicted dienelactone hydrolase